MKTWLHLSAEGLATPSSQWPCCLWRAAGDSQRMLLVDAAQSLAQQPVHLLLPMEMCSFLRTDPWPSKRRPSLQAIAFAIEEQLGEDLEELHISAGRRDRQGCYPVLVTHKARFKALLQLLASLGIKVCSVQVDADLRRGKPHVAHVFHGLEHVIDQLPQLGAVEHFRRHRWRDTQQALIAHFHNFTNHRSDFTRSGLGEVPAEA